MEIFLTIFYFILFSLIIGRLRFFNDAHIPKYWFIILFGVKVIFSVILTSIYTNYYTHRNAADIFKYFDDSKIMFDALQSNPSDFFKMLFAIDNNNDYFTANYYQYMYHWVRPYSSDLFSDSHIIIRFNTFVRLFSLGYFQVHNVFINFVSLLGLTAIFKAFKPYLQQKEKALFYVIFLIPTVLFWGSGLLKESIILFALGLLFYNLFNITKQFKFATLLFFVIGFSLLVYTKFYLLVALTIPVIGYLIHHYIKMKKPAYSYLIAGVLFLIIAFLFSLISERLNIIFQIADKQRIFSDFTSVTPTGSSFTIPELPDGFSILKNIPNALINTFIRPYFWECKSLFVWLSAFENLGILCCIIITFLFRKKMDATNQHIIYFNLIFVACLFIIIGLTTPVFGAIVRYKIPGLILLLISLLMIIDLKKIKIKHPFLKKIL